MNKTIGFSLSLILFGMICIPVQAQYADNSNVVDEQPTFDNFRFFIRQFYTDPKFQVQHVKFPLKKISVDETGELIEFLAKETYKPFVDTSRFKENYDMVIYSDKRPEIVNNTAIVELAGSENGINVKLKFIFEGGSWVLAEVNDSST